MVSGSEVPVGLAAGMPAVPLPVEDGSTVSLSEWARLGYGATLDDARPSVDVRPSAESLQERLAAAARATSGVARVDAVSDALPTPRAKQPATAATSCVSAVQSHLRRRFASLLKGCQVRILPGEPHGTARRATPVGVP